MTAIVKTDLPRGGREQTTCPKCYKECLKLLHFIATIIISDFLIEEG